MSKVILENILINIYIAYIMFINIKMYNMYHVSGYSSLN